MKTPATIASALLLALASLSPSLAGAAQSRPACELEDLTSLRKTYIDGRPSYFAKVNMQVGRNEIYFAATRPPAENSLNSYAMNLATGELKKVYGGVDPVPTPDGEFLTHPGSGGVEFMPITGGRTLHAARAGFYRGKTLKTTGPDGRPVEREERIYREDDPKLDETFEETYTERFTGPNGEPQERQATRQVRARDRFASMPYQSIGILPGGSNDRKVYRTIVDESPAVSGVAYADTEMRRSGGTPSFTERGRGVLCETVDGAKAPLLRLPMLSKDGLKLSIYDEQSGTSKVYSVDPSDPSRCTTLVDLQLAAGKAEFDKDNQRIAFHSDLAGGLRGQWFGSPTATDPATGGSRAARGYGVYVYDLREKSITRVSSLNDGSAYYPSFRDDGSVAFLTIEGDGRGRFAAVVADPSKGRSIPFSSECLAPTKEFAAAVSLGTLWGAICKQSIRDAANAALVPLSLDPSKCREMVRAEWGNLSKKVVTDAKRLLGPGAREGLRPLLEAVTEADLLAACPSENREAAHPVVLDNTPPPSANEGRLTLKQAMSACLGCHQGAIGSLPPFPSRQTIESSNAWLDEQPPGPTISLAQDPQASVEGAPSINTWRGRLWRALRKGGKMNPYSSDAPNQFQSIVPDEENREELLRELFKKP